MGSRKAITTAGILLLTLAVPALLFVFLHTFGENQFVIPVYYQDGVPLSRENCTWLPGPYQVPDFTLFTADSNKVSSAILDQKTSIIHFVPATENQEMTQLYADLNRLMTAFQTNASVQLLSLFSSNTSKPDPDHRYVNRWLVLSGNPETIDHLSTCGFIVPSVDFPDLSPEYQLVLVDGKRRIRGYYDSREKEEIDRLITEIEILKTESPDVKR